MLILESANTSLISLLEDGFEVGLELVVEERLVPQHLLTGGSAHDNIGVYWKKSIDIFYVLKTDLTFEQRQLAESILFSQSDVIYASNSFHNRGHTI